MKCIVALLLFASLIEVCCAGSLEEDLLILGTLGPKSHCASQFPELKKPLTAAFKVFAERNSKYRTASEWALLDQGPPFPYVTPLTKEVCEKYVVGLPDTDIDKAISTLRTEQACQKELDEVIVSSKGERPLIGIETAREFQSPRIARIQPGLPADSAGVRSGDIIKQYDGKDIASSCELSLAIIHSQAGKVVPLAVQRGDQLLEMSVTPKIGNNEN